MTFTTWLRRPHRSSTAAKALRNSSRRTRGRRLLPSLDRLEDRTLLSVSLIGVPIWAPEGPSPEITNSDVIGPTPATTQDVGAVEALAVDPHNSKHVFAGSVNGGIWQTVDFTAPSPTWTTTTDRMPSLAIGSIAFSPVHDNVVYAGTGSYTSFNGSFSSAGVGGGAVGVYKSSDGGATWQIMNPNNIFTGLRIERIIPTTLNAGQTVFLATADSPAASSGVYRSDDGGVSWTRLSGANGLPSAGVSDLVENPLNANQFFAAVPASLSATPGIFRLDLGINNTWGNVTNNITAADLGTSLRIELSISPAGANPVWASIINTTGFYQRVYRGLGAGTTMTWAPVGPFSGALNQPPDILSGNHQGKVHGAIAADPTFDNLVYLSGDATSGPMADAAAYIVRGNSTANSWTALTPIGAAVDAGTAVPTSNGDTTAPHADSRALVFASSVLLCASDGGVYGGTNPSSTSAAAQVWTSINGVTTATTTGIQDSEMYDISYDNVFHIILGGDQDTGNPSQSAAGSFVYGDEAGGDGGATAVDNFTLAGKGEAVRYIYSTVRKLYSGAATRITGDIDASIFPQGGLAGFVGFTGSVVDAIGPTAAQLSAGQSTRVVIAGGTNMTTSVGAVYESNNAGSATETGVLINGVTRYVVNDTWTKILTGPGFVSVNAIVANSATDAVIAYGGQSGGVANPDVLYAASGSKIFLRTVPGGTLTATPAQPSVTGPITAIALDPNDWRTAFVTDNTLVYMTTDAGATWNPITGNLFNNTSLNARLSVIAGSGDLALLFGGTDGVFRMLTSAPGVWTQFGAGLPNAIIGGMTYNAADDVLVVGTFGRGAWEVANASTFAFTTGVLQINGDTDAAYENDTIKLQIDPNNPLLLDVFLNSSNLPTKQVQLSIIQRIDVNGLGGTNTLVLSGPFGNVTDTFVNPTSGTINLGSRDLVYTGIQNLTYDGVGASDGLLLVGGSFTNETYSNFDSAIDPLSKSFVFAATLGLDGSTINFAGLSAVVDLIPVTNLLFTTNAAFEFFNLNDGPVVRGLQTTNISVYFVALILILPAGNVDFANKANVTLIDDFAFGNQGIYVDTRLAAAGLSSLTLNPGTTSAPSSEGAEILSTPRGVVTTLTKSGPGTTVFNVHSLRPGVGVQDIRGPIVVNDAFGGTTLNVDDSGDATGRTAQIGRDAINDLAPASITYTDAVRLDLTVTGGGGGNYFMVTSLGDANHFGPDLTLNSGSGSDTIDVAAFGYPSDDQINGGPGVDTLTVGGFNDTPKNIPLGVGSGEVDSPPEAPRTVVHYEGIEHVVTAIYGAKIPGEGDLGNDPLPSDVIIMGDLSGISNDTIVLRLDPNNAKFLQAIVNGVVQFDGSFAGFRKISIDSGYGYDVIDIEDIPAGLAVETIERDTSAVNVGKAHSLHGILGILDVVNPEDLTAVVLDDSADTTDHTVTVRNSGVRGLAPGTQEDLGGAILYSQYDIASLTIKGGSGRNTFNVNSTPNPGPFPIATTTIISGGVDTVNVGTSGSVQHILGTLIVRNPPNYTSLSVDDSADPTGRAITLGESTINGLAPADIRYDQNDLSSLTVAGGRGDNMFNIESTAAGVPTSVNGGPGHDTFDVGDSSNTLDPILGPLTVSGGGGIDELAINDQGTTVAQTLLIASTFVNRSGAAPISWTDVEGVTANAGSGGNTISIVSTGVPLTVNAGDGDDRIAVGGLAGLTLIRGDLSINGQGGNDLLTLNDQVNTGAHTYVVTATSVSRTESFGPAPIFYTDVEGLVLNAGSSTFLDIHPMNTINVESTAAGTPVAINTGIGTNTVNVGSPGNLLDKVLSLAVNGGYGGTTTLNLNDQANANGDYVIDASGGPAVVITSPTYVITSQSITRSDLRETVDLLTGQVAIGTAVAAVSYNNVASIAIRGGQSGNVFDFQSTAAATPVTINAGSGGDTINVGNGAGPINADNPGDLLDPIQGPLTIDGQAGINTVNVNDQGASPGQSYVVTANTLARAGAAMITFNRLQNVVLNASPGSSAGPSFLDIQGTAARTALTVNAGTLSDISVENAANRLDDILGPVTINGHPYEPFSINDLGNTVGHTYTLTTVPGAVPTANRLTRDGAATITFTGLNTLQMTGGTGANIFNIESLANNYITRIYGGGGADVFNVSPKAHDLDNLSGILDLEGEFPGQPTANASLTINDQSHTAARNWLFGAYGLVAYPSTGSAAQAVQVYFYVFNTVVANCGSGGNAINVVGMAAGTPVTINAGSGSDTINVGNGSGPLNAGNPGLLDPIQGALTVNGQAGNNALNVNDQGAADFHYYDVSATAVSRLNAKAQADIAPISYARIQTLTVSAGSAGDYFDATSTRAGTSTILNGGAGVDEFVVTGNSTLDDLKGPLTLHPNGGSYNSVELSDFLNPIGQTYNFTATSLQRSGIALISWDPVAVGLFASDVATGVSHINVLSVSAGYAQSFAMGTNDILTVGSKAPGLGGNLDNILGSIVAEAYAGQMPSVVIDDSGDPTAHPNVVVATDVTDGNVVTGLAPAPLYFRQNTAATLDGGSGGNTFDVQSTAAGTSTTINAGRGDDTVNVGNGSGPVNADNPGRLDGIQGPLRVNGQAGNNALNVNDQGSVSSHDYGVTATAVSRSNAVGIPDAAAITYAAINTLTVNASTPAGNANASSITDILSVYGTAAGTSTVINGGTGYNEFVFYGNGGTMNDVKGPVTLNSGGYFYDFVIFNDSVNPVGQTYNLTATSLKRSGIALVTWDPMSQVILYTGSGADHVNVQSVSASTFESLVVGTGDTVTIGSNAPARGGNLANILGPVRVESYSGQTPTVIVNDSDDTTAHPDVVLDTAGIYGNIVTGLAPAPIYLQLNPAAPTTILGGSGNDVFTINAPQPTVGLTLDGGGGTNTLIGSASTTNWQLTGANRGSISGINFVNMQDLVGGPASDTFTFGPQGSVSGTIDGGGGGDWLDYEQVTSNVTVNLATETASRVAGGIANIQNVGGGAGRDVLTGNAQGNILVGGSSTNVLTGGSGRSLLIGGNGASTITGGSGGSPKGGDIMIAGSSSYDTPTTANDLALMAILAEWQSADSLTTRFTDINNGTGGGLNGSNKLNYGTTVVDNGKTNTLTAQPGAAAVDWFFGNIAAGQTTINNLRPGDHENNA